MIRSVSGLSVVVVVVVVCATFICASFSGARAETHTEKSVAPDQLIRQLYQHDAAVVVNGATDSRVKVYFDQSLADLILKDHHADDSDQISTDPIFDTNGDTTTTNLQIGAPKYDGENATVVVIFTLKESGFHKKITYSLHKTPQGWRIANLTTNEWNLRGILTKLHPTGR